LSRTRRYPDLMPETEPDKAVFAGEVRIILWL